MMVILAGIYHPSHNVYSIYIYVYIICIVYL